MPGIGTAIGFVFDLFGSKAERRRNAIDKLKKEKHAILRKPQTDRAVKRLNVVLDKLSKLRREARNN